MGFLVDDCMIRRGITGYVIFFYGGDVNSSVKFWREKSEYWDKVGFSVFDGSRFDMRGQHVLYVYGRTVTTF